MPKRVPVQTIIVNREGKNIRPPIGKPFDFTPEELDDIMRVNPAAVTKIENVEINDDSEAKAKAEADALKANEAAALKAAKEKAEAEAKAKAEAAKKPAGGKTGADSL